MYPDFGGCLTAGIWVLSPGIHVASQKSIVLTKKKPVHALLQNEATRFMQYTAFTKAAVLCVRYRRKRDKNCEL